jgi:thioredoxin-like negative regulator of GroEL
MLPFLEAIAEKKKDKMTLLKVDADDNKDLLKQKSISGIPYLELYQDGKLIWKHEGFIEEVDLLKETKL